jgi:hypothetical protein
LAEPQQKKPIAIPIPMPIPMFLVEAKPCHDNLLLDIRELRWREDDLKLHLSLAQVLGCACGP